MTRDEHVAWCKKRALEYCDQGNLNDAITSMVNDLGKHSKTVGHSARDLSLVLLVGGHLLTPDKVRKFINGIN